MRITTLNAFETSIGALQRRQNQLTESQEQLTSGKRVRRASDDPTDAARAERALAQVKRTEAQQRALDASRNAMRLAESALGDAGELLQQVREKLVAAGNGSYSDRERLPIGEAIRGLRNDLLAIANRHDGAGRFLFGGQGADAPPLVDAPGGVAWNGTAGTLTAAAGESTPLTLDGRAAFLQAADPLNAGALLSVFDALDQAATELSTPGRSSADVAATVRDGMARLDAATENLGRWRARAGESLRRMDDIESRLSQLKLDGQTERSAAEDLDMVAAISEFQNQQTGYSAALQTYSMVQRLSLFDYIR